MIIPSPSITTQLAPAMSTAAPTYGTTNSSTPGSTAGNSAAPSSSSPANIQNQFLQLMVAELQNQDPTNPADPTQFLTQLTQINSVEQLVQANQTLTSIQTALTPPAAGTGTGTTAPVAGAAGVPTKHL